jgi:hypothetical protein
MRMRMRMRMAEVVMGVHIQRRIVAQGFYDNE